jgi:hypothetical protein
MPIFSGLFPIFSGLLYGDVIEAANVAEGESTTSMASYAGAKSDMKKVNLYSVVSCFSEHTRNTYLYVHRASR